MKIWTHPYALIFKDSLQKKEGVLIKVEFDTKTIGFADIFPWETLGDLPIQRQLSLLKSGVLTPIVSNSLRFAKLDAEARRSKCFLFQDLVIPQSHTLLTSLKKDPGEVFGIVKIKMWEEIDFATDLLLNFFKSHPNNVRIDFNARLSMKQFIQFLEKIRGWLERVDFIEDPFPYDENAWKWVQKNYPVALACDADSHKAIQYPESASFLIIKPAKQVSAPFISVKNKVIVTSYLDHPFGQVCAAYVAATSFSENTCGLISHQAYENTIFSEALQVNRGVIIPPGGFGFGFDDLLNGCTWNAL